MKSAAHLTTARRERQKDECVIFEKGFHCSDIKDGELADLTLRIRPEEILEFEKIIIIII